MTTKDFTKQAKAGNLVKIEGETYTIKEVVLWKLLRSGGSYHKYTLVDKKGDDKYRFAEDPESGRFIFVRIFDFKNKSPFLPSYTVNGKKFEFTYGEVCIAEKVSKGAEHKKGSSDIWCDYENPDGSYMSLGTIFPSGTKEDLIGKWINPEDVSLQPITK